ncbi:MAG TPA: NADH-quinone oxidoreductase subunit NuoE [Thermoplasmata archaeon]|nr:NADH-quinone oxidoreductase subunit NuoE [Thermoplasmata archaeon]
MDIDVRQVIESFRGQQGALIPALQAVQRHQGYISPDSVAIIEDVLGVPQNEVYGVATFYAQFRFERPGVHTVKVCLGTACHVRGGASIMDVVEEELGVRAGGTTHDGMFSLERVACMGCCAVAPVVVVDDELHGKMSPGKAREEIRRVRGEG